MTKTSYGYMGYYVDILKDDDRYFAMQSKQDIWLVAFFQVVKELYQALQWVYHPTEFITLHNPSSRKREKFGCRWRCHALGLNNISKQSNGCLVVKWSKLPIFVHVLYAKAKRRGGGSFLYEMEMLHKRL